MYINKTNKTNKIKSCHIAEIVKFKVILGLIVLK